jgi:hypothetical protein
MDVRVSGLGMCAELLAGAEDTMKKYFFAFFILIVAAAGVFVYQDKSHNGLVPAVSAAAINGTLRVGSNARYFTDGSGKAIYLTGSHNSNNLQDGATVGQPITTIFDFADYLNFLQAHNHNFIRMWMYEAGENGGYYEPVPWARNASGKYDLTQFNQAYFDRLRQRVSAANARGIYVSVMLFQGWSIKDGGYGNPWPLNPFNKNMNINGINGDSDGNGQGRESHTLQNSAIQQLQESYVRKVIATVDDLPNVLYEISNEDDNVPGNTEWQYSMIRYVKGLSSHPVGMTVQGEGSDQTVFNSPADWISPGDGAHRDSPPASDGTKVVISDIDHFWPDGADRGWVWKSFTRGLNPIYLGHYESYILDDPQYANAKALSIPSWAAMGQSLTYANKMNLAAMTPHGDLSSTGYALANPSSEYLVYQPGSGSFSVNLQSGTYQVEWLNPANGQTSSGGTVNGGGSPSFNPPFSGDAVLYVKTQGGGSTPTPTPEPSGVMSMTGTRYFVIRSNSAWRSMPRSSAALP